MCDSGVEGRVDTILLALVVTLDEHSDDRDGDEADAQDYDHEDPLPVGTPP